ncbi:FAD-dependent monooxygenase [Streptomyces sp. NPDC051907]|uniref:FAD-dependent monooxygenase n=1 Tax=Streptomyces sp. NPDC051907 TaxID=3155284 RepID=UPI0034234EC5
MAHTDVLVVGAGPVGLTAAAELRRRGVGCRIVDKLPARLPYAKAVGIQPRTLELWDRMGMVRAALDSAAPMRGQIAYVNGVEQFRIEMQLPPEVPYGFACLPQYETERLLEEHLARWDTRIERGTELLSFEQDEGGVWSRLATPNGEVEEFRSRFLIGCDGAHSVVRKTLGLSFEGGAFPEEYMLADVEVGWSLPAGYGVRAMHMTDGSTDDLMVCIPLPGTSRYRVSMLVPPELSVQEQQAAGGEDVAHGLEGGRAPGLEHVQAVLDRLAPEPATASALRWSSIFRISHRLVDRYGDGRVFVAGDAAHIHPPTGAQGMNTGVQDAYNLAWKLALAVAGTAGPELLSSYDAERRPIGEEVVSRTVRHAKAGVTADADDASTILLREAQLLLDYRGSPIVGASTPGHSGPDAGDRAPDCGGLVRDIAAFPLRLFDLLRACEGHLLLLYADGQDTAAQSTAAHLEELAAAARRLTHGQVDAYAILAQDVRADVREKVLAGGLTLPTVHDSRGEFQRAYGAESATGFLIRPDGYVGLRLASGDASELAEHLSRVFRT